MLKKLSDAMKDGDNISGCEVWSCKATDDVLNRVGRIKDYGIGYVSFYGGNVLAGWATGDYAVQVEDKK